MTDHVWIRGGRRADRWHLATHLDLPPVLIVLDAHRRLRGPYTAAGTLLRAVLPDALARVPRLGPAHRIEIRTCAPELADTVPQVMTLEGRVRREQRTRYHSRLHTLNIANGLAELLRDHRAALGSPPRTLVVENVDAADPTDAELVAVLLRRTDLPGLTVVVGSTALALPDPPGERTVSLADCLARHARTVDVPIAGADGTAGADGARADGADGIALARAYVDGDCVDDRPALARAYANLPDAVRARLHDERAEALEARGERSLALGAIPFHRERGGDREAAVRALSDALDHCRAFGLYQAAVDLGRRGAALATPSDPRRWGFVHGSAVCLATLGRADESIAAYTEAAAGTQDPDRHLDIAYGIAMVHTRHYPEPRRDHRRARAFMNLAVAMASQLPESPGRTFNTVFSQNGLALVDVRQNDPAAALRLLEDGIARMDAELPPGEHEMHRLVLRYNRAQVLALLDRPEEALAEYLAVVQVDPDFREHHFAIGNLLRRLGRPQEALEAYQRALRVAPPFEEGYHNLGDTRLELGDPAGALADFTYSLELEPDQARAHLGRATALAELDRHAEALEATAEGLALAPRDARLLALRAQSLAATGDEDGAWRCAPAAVEADPTLPEAWAVRAGLAHRAGDHAGALADLDRALELADRPEVRFNRGVALQSLGRFPEAAQEYATVLADTGDPDAAARLARCREAALR